MLGNLPRSRPGTRSEKRGADTAEPVKARAPRKTPPPEPEPSNDPVSGALRGVVGIAGAGLRAADGVTRHVLRRIPRP